jgi:hypothetical protein
MAWIDLCLEYSQGFVDLSREDLVEHPQACGLDECWICGMRDCPHNAPEHYWHDGCPSCTRPAENVDLPEQPPLTSGEATYVQQS